MTRLALLLAAAAIVSTPSASADRLQTKVPGGKLQLDYGRPSWHADLEGLMTQDFSWRFGSNSPTVLQTEAGLVFEDLVVFPGTYNLNALFYTSAPGRWLMTFHGDGHWYASKINHGSFWVAEDRLAEEELVRRFTVEFTERDGGHVLRATFGPRRVEAPFRAFATRVVKGKTGRTSFESTYLLREDVDEIEKAIEKRAVGVARVTGKKVAMPLRLLLRGGSTPKLFVCDTRHDAEAAPVAVIDGQRSTLAAPVPILSHSVASGKAAAVLTFELGGASYQFELPATVFDQ